MKEIHRIAQLLVSAWLLGTKRAAIPSAHGVLDRALFSLRDDESLPEWLRQNLHFSDSRAGTLCVELGAILSSAQDSELTAAPNPSYQHTEIKISRSVASRFVQKLGVSAEDAAKMGRRLSEAIEKINPQ